MLPVVRWQIVADFLALVVAFYALLRWVRSARAMRIALGIVGLHALALLARRLDLVVTSWVLDASAILVILVLLLIFQPELRRAFMHQLESRAPRNKVIVAIANKPARIVWAVLAKGEPYRATAAVGAA
jgi:DNA integrity scanning protein DisA with diadenylate cyclase activity